MLDLQDDDVAKKKTGKQAKPKKPETKGREWQSQPIVVQLRGSEEFKTAVKRMAEADGKTVAGLVDQALRTYARHIGFTEPIPKR